MRSGPDRFIRAPRRLRQPGVKLDNIALVPASLLPFRDQWQELANSLPAGEVLIILPAEDGSPRRILETVTTLLEAKGHSVTLLPAEKCAR